MGRITHGTHHFVSLRAAQNYYGRDVAHKIENGEIAIGAPALKTGEKLSVIKSEGRYQITRGA